MNFTRINLIILFLFFAYPIWPNNIVYLIRDHDRDLNNNLFKQADLTKRDVVWNTAWEPNMWILVRDLLAQKSDYVLKTPVASINNRAALYAELKDAKWVIDNTYNLPFAQSLDPQKDRWLLDKLIIMIYEPPVVAPWVWSDDMHNKAARILMWDDSLVDNKKYFLLHWNFYSEAKLKDSDIVPFEKRKKLCCMAGEPFKYQHPKQLYSPRRDAANYFEKNHPHDFDFFGYHWEDGHKYQTFKGKLPYGKKKEYLKHYKFCLAYENMRDVDGWITERIFNCFESGCVPIYWGARNVRKYIPEGCFVDREKFATLDELYKFISTMSKADYEQYLRNIQAYLNSDAPKEFSAEKFAEHVVKAILT